jgi:hypothetical protein
MMMGIGTPSRKSKIERIVKLLNSFDSRPTTLAEAKNR